MFRKIRDSRSIRFWSIVVSFSMLLQIVAPTTAFALTGGASQPEVNSFTPIGTSDMVDPFSGGFNYNIPLMDVGGHPINLSYNGAPTMDQEATMVGLGWNLNAAGQINRSLRGIPDDFNSDKVVQENNMRKNWTFGMSAGVGVELFGVDPKTGNGPSSSAGGSFGVNYNNYNGVSISSGANVSLNLTQGASSGGLGLSANNSSSGGLTISPSLSFSQSFSAGKNGDNSFSTGLSIGASFNSRQGLTALSVSASASGGGKAGNYKKNKDSEKRSVVADNSGSMGASIGGSVSLMNNTYVPNLDLPRTTTSMSGLFKLGATIFGQDGDVTFSGYYTEQGLSTKYQKFPAYGTAYEEYGVNGSSSMMDFNREKQRAFSRSIPDLHTTNHSYDLFNISGQGVGGMFRIFRSEVGLVHDNEVNDKSTGGKANVEVNPGSLFSMGVSTGVTRTLGGSGNWNDDNLAKSALSYQGKADNNPYEPYYFKHTGEITVDDEMQDNPASLFNKSGGYDAVRLGVNASGFTHQAVGKYIRKDATIFDINSLGNKRAARSKRNQIITPLTNSEAQYGIEGYKSPSAQGHHFSEMTVVQNNGSRYVYGIPAYNTLKRDVSFNATGRALIGTGDKGMVSYVANSDNSTGNERGRDHYFNRTTLPPYAHSYLLTSVLSQDYVDRTNNGVTADDYGSFTKFNYGDSPDISNYKWRVPFNEEEANYSEGLKTDPGDQKGSYVYGEKEIWYLDNIETKTHVAVFNMSDRRDGYGVTDENGGLGGNPMQKLDKVSLYARSDYYLANGAVNPNATPIKEVHFEYDYSLCPGVDNNVDVVQGTTSSNPQNLGGKLTLKRVYFTYANSHKGELSDYQFVYADPDHDPNGIMEANYPYDLKSVNAWGGYQAQVANAGFGVDAGLLNSEYPYVDQNNKAQQTQYVNAWALTSIKLPSGGRIDVDLEPHEYAYVQDREALQMYKVLGCNSSTTAPGASSPSRSELYDGSFNQYLHLAIPPNTTRAQLFKNLINGKPLYYRFLIDLTNGLDADDGSYEYVEGYLAKELIEDYDVDPVAGTAWIKVKGVSTNGNGSGSSHPIAKSAWQFARSFVPKKAFDQPDPQNGATLIDVAKLLASQVTNVVELFTGSNGLLKQKKYGRFFNPSKSWIRLNTPDLHKLGGGARVAAIKMYDNWEFMTEKSNTNSDGFDHDFDYGQTYSYTLEDGISSSGVATYEPLGTKDNPLIQPVYFSEEHLLAPDGKHYMEEPYGESFYPGPSIGYSRIEVANLSRTNVKKHATGRMVHEFYTCRDYPVRVDRTGLFSDEKRTGLLGSIFKVDAKNYAVASQGFVIETNDMHGKQKAQKVYAEGQIDPISGTKYVYDHNYASASPNGNLFQNFNGNNTKLNNDVTVITPNGMVETRQIGVDFDMINDFGESRTEMVDINIDFNLATFNIPIPPAVILIPMVIPRRTSEKTRYRNVVTTKVINRFGILREVIAYDLGAAVSTRNKAWDSETGEVLLTETTNEYGDNVFNFNYPAHWYYKGMGQAYQNIGMDISINTGPSGEVVSPVSMLNYLHPGDEIGTTFGKFWIDDDGTDLKVIDINGDPLLSTTINGKIVRSGHRNMQAMSIGNITMLDDPLADVNDTPYPNGTVLPLFKNTTAVTDAEVVNTSISEFSDDWVQSYCNCDLDITQVYNPYVHNAKGAWRMKKEHLYLVGRNQTNDKTTREEGTYSSYKTFWRKPGTKWLKNNFDYTWSSEVSKFSPYGFELENQDRLGRYSAAQYDYNNNLPTAVANNARYSDIGFDGFEEYHFDECSDDHFSFESELNHPPQNGADHVGGVSIVETESHTGRKSIKLKHGASVTIEKDLLDCK